MVFLDPKVAAVTLVSKDGKLVLVRRDIEPARGRWTFPGGYVDRGEVVEDAAIREVREETGLEAELCSLIGLYSQRDTPVIVAAYAGRAVGGCLQAGPEVQEVALFSPDELPPLPFPHDYTMLQGWHKLGSHRE